MKFWIQMYRHTPKKNIPLNLKNEFNSTYYFLNKAIIELEEIIILEDIVEDLQLAKDWVEDIEKKVIG